MRSHGLNKQDSKRGGTFGCLRSTRCRISYTSPVTRSQQGWCVRCLCRLECTCVMQHAFAASPQSSDAPLAAVISIDRLRASPHGQQTKHCRGIRVVLNLPSEPPMYGCVSMCFDVSTAQFVRIFIVNVSRQQVQHLRTGFCCGCFTTLTGVRILAHMLFIRLV